MIRQGLIAAIFIITSCGAASPQSLQEKTGLNAAIGAPPSTRDFILAAHETNLFQQASLKMGTDRGDDRTRALAKTLSAEGEKRNDSLRDLIQVEKIDVELSDESNAGHANKLGALSGSVGPALVKKFAELHTEELKDAIALFQRYVADGENLNVRSWAQSQLPGLEKSLADMK